MYYLFTFLIYLLFKYFIFCKTYNKQLTESIVHKNAKFKSEVDLVLVPNAQRKNIKEKKEKYKYS